MQYHTMKTGWIKLFVVLHLTLIMLSCNHGDYIQVTISQIDTHIVNTTHFSRTGKLKSITTYKGKVIEGIWYNTDNTIHVYKFTSYFDDCSYQLWYYTPDSSVQIGHPFIWGITTDYIDSLSRIDSEDSTTLLLFTPNPPGSIKQLYIDDDTTTSQNIFIEENIPCCNYVKRLPLSPGVYKTCFNMQFQEKANTPVNYTQSCITFNVDSTNSSTDQIRRKIRSLKNDSLMNFQAEWREGYALYFRYYCNNAEYKMDLSGLVKRNSNNQFQIKLSDKWYQIEQIVSMSNFCNGELTAGKLRYCYNFMRENRIMKLDFSRAHGSYIIDLDTMIYYYKKPHWINKNVIKYIGNGWWEAEF